MAAEANETIDQEINATRDVWQFRDSFNFNAHIGTGQTTEQLSTALSNNRERLAELKQYYTDAVEEDGGLNAAQPSRKRRNLFKELHGLYSAIEGIKAELRIRGAANYQIDDNDEEHPNAAYRRLRPTNECYVVSKIYGGRSFEALRAKRVCRRRFVFNPWVAPGWALYRLLGKYLAGVAGSSLIFRSILDVTLARPIIHASQPNLLHALPWVIYIGICGWMFASLPFLVVGALLLR